jgi:hypothetical protein
MKFLMELYDKGKVLLVLKEVPCYEDLSTAPAA